MSSPSISAIARRVGRTLLGALLASLPATVAPAALQAQVGTTTEIIIGRVTGPDSQPIVGARVEITSLATGAVRRTTTRSDGRFSMLFREGGTQFRLTVTAIGRAPASIVVARRPDEDRLVAEVRLNPNAATLSTVQVRGRASRPGAPPASGAGASEAIVGQGFLQRFPVSPGDLTNVVQIMPGVVGVAGGDSTPASFSVAGQPANQNNITVDGASFLFGSLPQNGVRAVRLVTNAYDPARGQFTGGQIATTTQAGTGRLQGNLTANYLAPGLQTPTAPTGTFLQRGSSQLLSGGAGGPLVRDKAYWFASLDVDRRAEPFASLLDADPAALANLGVSQDSLNRFLAFANARGLAGRTGIPSDRDLRTVSSLVRLDWDVATTHALTLRGDWRRVSTDASRISNLALPSVAARTLSQGGGGMATLTSSLGTFVNEARVYLSGDLQDLTALRSSPLGVVNVGSVAAGGRSAQVQLQFGGNPSLPRRVETRLTELTDELSWLAGTTHRLKLGVLLNDSRVSVRGQGNQIGTFVYNSLSDLEAGRPALYARTLGGTDQRAGATTLATWLGDSWRTSPSFQLVYGARLETTRLRGAPAANAGAAQSFGARTDEFPSDWRITPRVGFTWLLGNVAGIPAYTLKGGAGLFRGTVPAGLVAAVANGNGLPGAQLGLVCVGAQVPSPDWTTLANDPTTAPEQCVGGVGSSFGQRPSVLFFAPHFGAPEVWRASFGVTRQIRLRWAVAMEALVSYGTRGVGAIDRNLGNSSFTLGSEAARPVFTPLGTIAPTTGASSGNDGRPVSAFGPALKIGTGGQSRSAQLTVTLAGPSFRGGGTSLSYTTARVMDRSNGFGLGSFLPNTAGDPNAFAWGTSDLERRHQIVGQQISSFPKGLELTVIVRAISGSRYTPMVNGDVNGDSQRNDRAFIPSASGSDPVSVGMRELLASADRRAVRCLQSQTGRIAERNSCATPWTPQLDLQLNWKPPVRSFDDRFTLSLVATNSIAMLDRLLHGDRIRGWGQPMLADRNLLTVTGFDPATQRFQYDVNRRFGTPTGTRNPLAVPFQLSIRAQYALGLDQGRANLRTLTGAGSRDSSSVSAVKARVMKQVPFFVDSLFRVADSLKLELTEAQRSALTEEGMRYRTAVDPPLEAIAALLASNGGRPDLGAIAPKLQEQNLAIVRVIQQSLQRVRGIVTPEQWAKIPDKIRYPFGQQGG
jgi:hypothetical protein